MIIDQSTADLFPDNDKNEEQVFLKENINSYNLKPLIEKKHSAMMYLNTLSPFSAYSSGEYIMTALKKTTGTENFLNIPDEERKCHLETFEQCQNKRFLEEVVNRCGCLPWALNNALTPKVNRVTAFRYYILVSSNSLPGCRLLFPCFLCLPRLSLHQRHPGLHGFMYWTPRRRPLCRGQTSGR